MGIQAIKGVEVGDGSPPPPARLGRHDEIERGPDAGCTVATDRGRRHRGRDEHGEVLRVRAAMKPIATVPRALDTVDVATGEPAVAIKPALGCLAPSRRRLVAEAMVALVSPTPRWRSSAATASGRPRATCIAFLDAIPDLMRAPR